MILLSKWQVEFAFDFSDIVLLFNISKIIGILSILMSGAIYYPLSSDQPPERLNSLIEHVQVKCILVHRQTEFIGVIMSV